MAAVNVTLDGMLYDLLNKSSQRVVFIGDASLTGLSVGGGPMPPGPGMPGIPGHPEFPIWGPPGIELPPGPGYPPVAGHPLPPIPPIPPDITVPPGTVITIPGNQPVQPIVPPPFIKVYYPGVGWVLVSAPAK
jgi:hypothetical protein